MNLTAEAIQGYDWATRQGPRGLPGMEPDTACPYIRTSPASMAWHLGRHLASLGSDRPADIGIREHGRLVVMTGRGDTFSVRGRCDMLMGRYAWRPDNTFRAVKP